MLLMQLCLVYFAELGRDVVAVAKSKCAALVLVSLILGRRRAQEAAAALLEKLQPWQHLAGDFPQRCMLYVQASLEM